MREMRLSRRTLFYSAALTCGLALIACSDNNSAPVIEFSEPLEAHRADTAPHQHAESETVYRFGFDLRASPQEDARQYLPFLRYLEHSTGYRFKLHFAADQHIIDDLGTNTVQFAALGASSYILAKHRYGAIPVVRGLNHDNKAEYRSALVVAPNSAIQRIADLKGKRMAFGNISSTQGHLIPRIILSEFNVELSELNGYEYTGSHSRCADAVISGRYDVCGMQDTMAEHLAAQGLLKILHFSEYFPSSGITANKYVPDEVIANVRNALVNFQPNGRDGPELYNWDKTEMPNGFVATHDEDYAKLRRWSIALGLIELNEPAQTP